MAKLTIRLMGRPQIAIDGEPLSVDTRKAIALLVYLVVTRQAHRRSALSVLLWPDSDQERGRTALRRTLATLNKALGSGWLEADRKIIGINWESIDTTHDLWVDVHQLRAAVGKLEQEKEGNCGELRPFLQEASDLYQGSFLQGFSLADSAAFDDWSFFQGEQVKQDMVRVWRKLIDCLAQSGAYEPAITHARQWLSLDMLHEEAHQQLMQLYAWAGQRNAALRQYDECVRILDEEIGVEPQAETTAVYNQILNNELPTPLVEPVAPSPKPLPVSAISKPRHNLPRIGTPFVGRDKELMEVNGRLDNANCKLLTIIGPGGVGKSRLALETGKSRLDTYQHGVYFVPLTEVNSAEHLAPLIADTIHFSFFGQQDLQAQLLNYLQDKEMLLILDNFEHMLEGADFVAEAAQTVPDVQFLITTQERLNVREEWLYEIEAFASPTDSAIEESSAYQLFVERARQIQPDFAPTEADKRAIAQICRFVGGLALGIELASTWVRILSCAEIVAQMDQSLDFLTTSLRNIPERHRSLKAVFEYSWQLLTDGEQETFARLAVFRGGFHIPSALKITQVSLPSLLTLTDKSLVRLGGNGRHEIPAVLRQYAKEKFQEETNRAEIERQFADYFLQFLIDQEANLKGAQQLEALRDIRAEIENIRGAWRYGVANGLTEALLSALPTLLLFYETRSWFAEGVQVFEDALAVVENGRLRGYLLLAQGVCWYRQAQFERAEALLDEGLATLRQLDDQHGMAMGLYYLGNVVEGNGRHLRARQNLESALSVYQAIGDRWGTANVLNALGNVTFVLREYETARQHYQNSLLMRRHIGDQRGVAVCFHNMGNVPLVIGDYDEAKQLYQESLNLHRELRDERGVGHALNNIGYVCVLQEQYEQATLCLDEALLALEEIGDQRGIAHIQQNLGHVAFGRKQFDLAKARYEESRLLFHSIGDRIGVADVLSDLGRLALAQDDVANGKRWCMMALEIAQPVNATATMLQALSILAEGAAMNEAWETAVKLAHFVSTHPDTLFATRSRLQNNQKAWRTHLPTEKVNSVITTPLELETIIAPYLN